MDKAQKWVFTSWKRPQINESLIDYMVWQKEKCPTTQLEHYQGYIEFKKEYKLFQVKSLFKDKTMYVDKATKNRKANYNYCTKNESYAFERYEFGAVDTANGDPSWDDLLE